MSAAAAAMNSTRRKSKSGQTTVPTPTSATDPTSSPSTANLAADNNASPPSSSSSSPSLFTFPSALSVSRGTGFFAAACRFYLLSRPFWVAHEHAQGFHYYGQEEDRAESELRKKGGEEETERQPESEAAAAAAAVASAASDAAATDASSSSPSSSPSSPTLVASPFKHIHLNSPELIPRAPSRGPDGSSNSSTSAPAPGALFSTPSSSPFLAAQSASTDKINRITLTNIEPNERYLKAAAAHLPSVTSSNSYSSSSSSSFISRFFCGCYSRVSASTYVYFHSTPRLIAWSWSLLMVALLLMCTYLHVYMSYCHRNMSTALAAADQEAFYATLFNFLVAILLTSPLLAISQHAKNQLALHWRIYLTNKMLQQYFRHRNYYYLQAANSAGAGGRISEEDKRKEKQDKEKEKGKEKNQTPTSPTSPGAASTAASAASASTAKSKVRRSRRSVDNPDQRIADDIRSFTRSSLTFINEMLDELFQTFAFAGILYSISPALVFGLIVYALFGTYLATAVFGLQLIETNSKQSKMEADFRFSLVRVRTNAEAIAFYSGEHAELSYIYWRFSKIVRNLSHMAGIQCNLALFKHSYGFLTALIPPFFLAPLYFRGEVELGVISQSSMAFRQIFNSLNMIVSKMNELSKWRSGMERIWELECKLRMQDEIAERHIRQRRRSINMEQKKQQSASSSSSSSPLSSEVSWSSAASLSPPAHDTIQIRPSPHLHLEHVRVCVQGDPSDEPTAAAAGAEEAASVVPSSPATRNNGERVLVDHLTLFLPSLQHSVEGHALFASVDSSKPRGLLIMGRSGIGKSTLLRAIAGLWKNGSGTISRPNLSNLLFLPQRPYMILGTLRQQLLYPFCPQKEKNKNPSHRSHTLLVANAANNGNNENNTDDSTHQSTTATQRKASKESNKQRMATLTVPSADELGWTETGQSIFSSSSSSSSSSSASTSSVVPSTNGVIGLRRRWPVSRPSPSSSGSTCGSSAEHSPCSSSPPLSPVGAPINTRANSNAAEGRISGIDAANAEAAAAEATSALSVSTSASASDSEYDSIPSDEDLDYILNIVNLGHLTKGNAAKQQQAAVAAAGVNNNNNNNNNSAQSILPALAIHTPLSPVSSPPVSSPTPGLDVLCDWSDVLSLGESQRIAFARILIHQPSYVFCDEITAALDAHNEEKLYTALRTHAPRTCLVSVGHRPALLKHHSHVLHIQEGGRWEMLEINEQNQQAIEHITAVTTTT